MITRACFILSVFWALPVIAEPADVPENVVDVVGARREAERLDRPGTSYVIRPVDATRFDTKAQLGRSASLALPETGRISASGFVIPRVRGQDTRLTEVYVGDLLLQDPYSGLPLVDDLDLRAFGELAIHHGTAPLDLPTVGGIGIIQYRPRTVTTNKLTVGTTVGRPYGSAGFAVHDRAMDAVAARIYGRRHVTDGRYQYLDDGGTPYNTSDDAMRTRTGNDRRSEQLVPTLSWERGPDRIDALGLWQRGRSGIPPAYPGADQASEGATTSLSTIRYSHAMVPVVVLAPAALHLQLGHHDDSRARDDTGGAVGSSASSSLVARTRRLGLGLQWETQRHQWRADTDASRTTIEQRGGAATSLRRDAQGLHVGVGSKFGPEWQLETKGVWRRHTDLDTAPSRRSDQLTDGSASHRDHRGMSAALGYRQAVWSVYTQAAWRERPPSLLEEFGDAAYVRSNPDLTNEKSRHWEIGGSVANIRRTARLGAAVFKDATSDRLTFVPSLAQSVRAVNIGRADVRGAELNADLMHEETNWLASVTRLWPEDRTSGEHVRRLPGVPEWLAVAAVSQRWGVATARWQSRYRGQVFRDPLNDVQLPPALIHDAAVDATWPWRLASGSIGFDAGLAVENVTNVTSLPISARRGAEQSGEVAYGDIAGFPLPGRQWRLTAAATYEL